MDPWTIIGDVVGWFIICVFVIAVGSVPLRIIRKRATAYARWRRDRDEAPRAGDVWVRDDNWLDITKITDTGHICIRAKISTSSASWSESLDEWHARNKDRRAWRSVLGTATQGDEA